MKIQVSHTAPGPGGEVEWFIVRDEAKGASLTERTRSVYELEIEPWTGRIQYALWVGEPGWMTPVPADTGPASAGPVPPFCYTCLTGGCRHKEHADGASVEAATQLDGTTLCARCVRHHRGRHATV